MVPDEDQQFLVDVAAGADISGEIRDSRAIDSMRTTITVWMSSQNDDEPTVADTGGGREVALGGCRVHAFVHGLEEGAAAGRKLTPGEIGLVLARVGKLSRSLGGATDLPLGFLELDLFLGWNLGALGQPL
ncbi:hypothetical protein EVAR_4283_1 [Eumeta japonica]|uniref:Uncharacterized protein n=1 Tax=Eumeta variegata TaxID=151549 RepID=A0A4C1VBY4_EUMVA|nr:hypothetical protein EVAR_4283_1 [Eumeta japonica]